ncbi:UDP-N-acetylmuramoyl-tripeptide--D-alanyl-D-alanine ligase [Pseudomonas duriflava]|uniref:UDP-N-acetylmuramoyl-tripeptide--D-alanyl-D-alanine ligase n=1 Tax=Pseudomonas duriflava TaxID=459528 RepID=A0A562QNY6_9PSED|nr:UDP-N-acetylmuramoyl-tripeptide--D-alanyl-D-alanine ligase [Pseudomonas duriflava]TWI58471.1 UDP-N-acetylmuramoyl-tripeptide--D-alanyl-D-alanine ligase [Pseudomonas duriflava]
MLKPMFLQDLVAPLSARLKGHNVSFSAVSTDSRTIMPGQLFIALSGPRFDGHAYLSEVAAKGAVAALVEREHPAIELPQLIVSDTRQALGQIAALNRAGFPYPVAAVTGSSGKTTVKEMLASILRTCGPTLATQGNLNNDLGAPLTLLQLGEDHRYAVIELGASRIGEIAYTVGLTQPHVAIITNAGRAHVGEFGGVEKIIEAKGEILEGLVSGGVAVLNRDDKAFEQWQARASGHEVCSFGLNEMATFRAVELARDARGCSSFSMICPAGQARIQLNLLGEHNVLNALAAAAAAHAVGISIESIVIGLEALQPVKGRTVVKRGAQGARVIDDSYNANPGSMKAAVDVLSGFTGRTVLVAGDMGELGEWATEAHAELGSYAHNKVSALYGVGPLMAHAVEAFGVNARHFADQSDLINALLSESGPDCTFLIKGSRSAAMDKVVLALCNKDVEEKH